MVGVQELIYDVNRIFIRGDACRIFVTYSFAQTILEYKTTKFPKPVYNYLNKLSK